MSAIHEFQPDQFLRDRETRAEYSVFDQWLIDNEVKTEHTTDMRESVRSFATRTAQAAHEHNAVIQLTFRPNATITAAIIIP